MERVIRDGKVAVLYSPGFGSGWYSEHGRGELVFSPTLVEMVEANRQKEIPDFLDNTIGDIDYWGGARDLTVEWLPVGTRFTIEEYDGNESIRTYDDLSLTA